MKAKLGYLLMDKRKQYIDGYLNGVIGNCDDWTMDDVDYILSRVIDINAVDGWWNGIRPELNHRTPQDLWQSNEKSRVVNLAIGYLDTSFS